MIQLNLKKSLFTPKFFPYLRDYSHRWEFYMGSAGSAKSYFTDMQTVINTVNGLQGIVSDKTLLSQIPFVDDAETEAEAVKEQKQNNVALYNFGGTNTDEGDEE